MAITYECSDGHRVTETIIKRLYKRSKDKKYSGITSTPLCECCGREPGQDSDHTIAKARCKKIHKTELIWDGRNYVWSCRKCHKEWENFKSGEWLKHLNMESRLEFMKEHDPEGYKIRINLTEISLHEQIQNSEAGTDDQTHVPG